MLSDPLVLGMCRKRCDCTLSSVQKAKLAGERHPWLVVEAIGASR